MVDVKDLLEKAIAPYPLYLQGSRSGGNYENEFCTYALNAIDEKYRNNVPIMGIWEFDFNFYSTQLNYENVFNELIVKLRSAGFIPVGRGGDAPSDDKNYNGRSILIRYKENY